jgi:hypothetical protein
MNTDRHGNDLKKKHSQSLHIPEMIAGLLKHPITALAIT